MCMYSNLPELKEDLEMIGSLLECERELHIIGTAAIALVANIERASIGDIDTITYLGEEDFLTAFISDQASDLTGDYVAKGIDVLKKENTFKFGNLVLTTPNLDVLVKCKLIRSESKDIEFLEEHNLI